MAEIIKLEDKEAAIVVHEDGTMDIHMATDDPKGTASASQLLAVAMAYLMIDKPQVLIDAIDTVSEECFEIEELEGVSSDTEEAEDDTVQGED